MTVDAMRFVIETVLPFLGDTLINPNRQGATELVFSMWSLLSEGLYLLASRHRRRSEVGSQSTALRYLSHSSSPGAHERSR
jgi:hypothetical protein